MQADLYSCKNRVVQRCNIIGPVLLTRCLITSLFRKIWFQNGCVVHWSRSCKWFSSLSDLVLPYWSGNQLVLHLWKATVLGHTRVVVRHFSSMKIVLRKQRPLLHNCIWLQSIACKIWTFHIEGSKYQNRASLLICIYSKPVHCVYEYIEQSGIHHIQKFFSILRNE